MLKECIAHPLNENHGRGGKVYINLAKPFVLASWSIHVYTISVWRTKLASNIQDSLIIDSMIQGLNSIFAFDMI